ncbi:MAG: hypothetical protein ACU85V_03240 [Gammaproteobacteria bacterium]
MSERSTPDDLHATQRRAAVRGAVVLALLVVAIYAWGILSRF